MLKFMSSEKQKQLVEESFMKKQCTVDDIAEAVYFLISEKSNYINGQIIRLDGGMKN